METIQETKLIKTDRGHYYLFNEIRTNDGRLIRYEYLDETPILGSSVHYDTFIKLRNEMLSPQFYVKNAVARL